MVDPKFRVRLTRKDKEEIGRLSATWGQIDHFLLQSIALLLTHDIAAAITLMGELTTGPLVNLLSKSRHRVQDPSIKALIKKFSDDMGPLIAARNHLTHGIWGLYLVGKNPHKAEPACLFVKQPDNPLFPAKIAELADRAAEQTHVIARIWHHLADIPFPDGNPDFYFGQHQPRAPKGMQIVPVAQPPKGHRN
jgi:hypothetical protein